MNFRYLVCWRILFKNTGTLNGAGHAVSFFTKHRRKFPNMRVSELNKESNGYVLQVSANVTSEEAEKYHQRLNEILDADKTVEGWIYGSQIGD